MESKKLIIDLEGTELLPEEVQILKNKNVAGVILFSHNYINKMQLKKLIKRIRDVAAKELLIVVDHEGGEIWRFNNSDFTKIPNAEYFGILYDKNPPKAIEEAYKSGYTMAKELLDIGVDMSLAPVLDLSLSNNIIKFKRRSFHSNPEIVAKIAGSFIDGMKSVGMPCCGKHFPGHGFTKSDTHFKYAEDNRDFSAIDNLDLMPYKNLLNKLDYILASHVVYSRVDSNPGVYSKYWLQDILRNKLKFKGKIISDCLSMKAANKNNNLEKVKSAWRAGCDFIIYSQMPRSELKELVNTV